MPTDDLQTIQRRLGEIRSRIDILKHEKGKNDVLLKESNEKLNSYGISSVDDLVKRIESDSKELELKKSKISEAISLLDVKVEQAESKILGE